VERSVIDILKFFFVVYGFGIMFFYSQLESISMLQSSV
jgi:hypothetical protein